MQVGDRQSREVQLEDRSGVGLECCGTRRVLEDRFNRAADGDPQDTVIRLNHCRKVGGRPGSAQELNQVIGLCGADELDDSRHHGWRGRLVDEDGGSAAAYEHEVAGIESDVVHKSAPEVDGGRIVRRTGRHGNASGGTLFAEVRWRPPKWRAR